ncbi:MAG: glycosyltransferase [Anaerolineae bacterium]|nr:MAG: glycosyltransferase [Anaerolineae bacterium]
MMRVLFVYKDYAPVVGGIENHIRLLAEGSQQRGVDVRVLVTNTGLRTSQEVIHGVPVIKTGRLLNLSSAPISLAFYPWLYRLEKDVDVSHLHFPYPPGELGQLLLGRSRRFVLTYHSDIVRQRVLGLMYRPFLWQVLRRADLITVSNPVYVRTSPFLRRFVGKCRVIHHGIDLSRFIPTAEVQARAAAFRQRYGGRPLVLFVGRLRHYKGLDVLLEAMPQVPAHLLVVGAGPMAEVWQRQAVEAGLTDRVTFLGQVAETDLVVACYAADLFVLPSTNRAETWGAVQIEAMACGLPIVCTELGTGTSYVNQDGVTGIVVPPRDPDALAGAVCRLLADEALRRQMGEAGQKRVLREFSLEAMLNQVMAFYAEALEKSG